jgi:predicted dehydrogenase
MKVGIVGCGLIGRRRAQVAKQAGDEVVWVADSDAGRAQALAEELGCTAATIWQDLIDHAGLDALVAATPNKYLAPVSVAALERGLHVLCEKPPGRNASETEQMAAAARQSGGVLKIGFNHRHHPAIWQAHEACLHGAIGRPFFIRAVYGHGGRPGYDKEWRGSADLAGGGELLDQGVHILDLCRWFMGEFSQVYGVTATYFWPLGYFAGENSPQLEDNAFALLRTASGQTAQFHTSWTQWKNRFNFEVFGEKGYLRVEGLGGSYGQETLTIGLRRPQSGPPDESRFDFEGPDLSWQAEWKEFKTAIAEQRQPLASGEDGLQTMRLLEALYASARSGQVVSL